MTQAALGPARLPASLTSFVGREQETAEVARSLREHRLVTATGPGGVGKTRLAVEVARAMTGEFPDGVYFVGLRAVADETRVAAEVAAGLGVRQAPGKSPVETLTAALTAQRILLVLDNCEHVRAAAAELCRVLLESADDLHILATSREQLWVGGETRYRLAPLGLPEPAGPGGVAGLSEAAGMTRSSALALFADRARQADRAFSLTGDRVPLAARVVTLLDGIPLAIELAAARVEALGLAGLADRIDAALRPPGGADALAADPARSLTAVADWSYRLLTAAEQRVFRRVAAFPGPFTLEGAEAVAGPETGPSLLRLVDCSLVAPPRPGPDQRMRYTLLQTLRAYGLARLADAGEEREAAAALAGFALSVAEQAAPALGTRDGELGAARWLDAEDATVGQALDWALEHDQEAALRIAVALAPWWLLRGRVVAGYRQLAAAVDGSSAASESLGLAHFWLGHLADFADPGRALGHFTAASESADPRAAIDALGAGRAIMLLNYGQPAEAEQAARRAITLARAAGYRGGEAEALTALSVIAHQTNAPREALAWARQAEDALDAGLTQRAVRWCRLVLLVVLTESGEFAAARRVCGDSLARSRAVGDLSDLSFRLVVHARLERLSGNLADASARLREAVRVARRVGGDTGLLNCLDEGSCFCAEQGLWPAAVTLRAAYEAHMARAGVIVPPGGDYAELMRRARPGLSAGQARAAAERGARMTTDAAAEFIAALSVPREAPARRSAAELTERERELVALIAQGHTNAQIAARLFISVRTVTSHLDRIHGKTGYRRRADLTRLALSEGLV